MVALRITDRAEEDLPSVGMVPFVDPETGNMRWIDTSNKKTVIQYRAEALRRRDLLKTTFMKSRVDFAEIPTNGSYIKELTNLFKKREGK